MLSFFVQLEGKEMRGGRERWGGGVPEMQIVTGACTELALDTS